MTEYERGLEDAARLVDRWHISKGGFSELAFAIRALRPATERAEPSPAEPRNADRVCVKCGVRVTGWVVADVGKLCPDCAETTCHCDSVAEHGHDTDCAKYVATPTPAEASGAACANPLCRSTRPRAHFQGYGPGELGVCPECGHADDLCRACAKPPDDCVCRRSAR